MASSALGQTSSPTQAQTAVVAAEFTNNADTNPIVAGDVISFHVYDEPDLDAFHVRVTDSGTVPLLLVGSVKISGMTPGEASIAIADAYMQKHMLRDAHVQVTVETNASTNATVIGYINGLSLTTGAAVPLTSPRPLLTVLAMAGGLSERASRTVTIQHRNPARPRESVYLPQDAARQLDNDPMVDPGDIIVVPRADTVYVLGNVGRPSPVTMNNEDGRLTLIQALTQAGGTLPTSGLRKVQLFRKQNGAYLAMPPINVGKIMKGKAADVPLKAEDAIWIPFSYSKNFLVNAPAITAAVSSAATSGVLYTR
ncbi:polysaccharide export outer membrane protein [Granulicella aggregans]|uniref:Polysaccharide export outer membrane protein n=1 Tax=Granulicella aggregans TaxID=474949 RepID=A0A7W7ZHD8_9BACT|nr:polysaccharide biosynthesis/export family protein [Granulicella aggregans]MBB5059877.1 polysaccharide export outer membrane protein [Granulicella aggregans]